MELAFCVWQNQNTQPFTSLPHNITVNDKFHVTPTLLHCKWPRDPKTSKYFQSKTCNLSTLLYCQRMWFLLRINWVTQFPHIVTLTQQQLVKVEVEVCQTLPTCLHVQDFPAYFFHLTSSIYAFIIKRTSCKVLPLVITYTTPAVCVIFRIFSNIVAVNLI